MPSTSAKRSYRRKIRSSHCRKAGPATCRRRTGCKYVRGAVRRFCRKGRNSRRGTRASPMGERELEGMIPRYRY